LPVSARNPPTKKERERAREAGVGELLNEGPLAAPQKPEGNVDGLGHGDDVAAEGLVAGDVVGRAPHREGLLQAAHGADHQLAGADAAVASRVPVNDL